MHRSVCILFAFLLLVGVGLRVAELHPHDMPGHDANCALCRVASTPLADVPRCDTGLAAPLPPSDGFPAAEADHHPQEAPRAAARLRAPPAA